MGEREVVVARAASESIRRGHPWVWKSAVGRGLERTAAGEVVKLMGAEGELLGRGVADPDSPIAVRVWVTGDESLGDALLHRKIARAFEVRARLFGDGRTTAYRLLHGEGDRLPGFVLDRYADVAVLRLDGAGAEAFAERVVPLLWEALGALGVKTLVRRVVSRGESKGGKGDGGEKNELLRGSPLAAPTVEVAEHGVPFVVDVARGQKTGAFLDQRENRRRVGEIVAARGSKSTRVLNLFSYAGGFSLRAALAGAEVTSVDLASGAHATAQASFKRAGVDPKAHAFVTADAFAFLAEAKKARRTWDVVVSDPPSFAPSEKALPRAVSAYRALHRACADVLAPSGVFCAASCSSHVDAETFAATLDDTSLGRSDLRLLSLDGPGPDHPTVPSWPEGRYLKFAVLA
ncbi:MAG TPA: class I SAM-dependent rRNA methyltransferase [Polyangiaceae bacterium]|jgi:23S rRNA (cytosine1962-C5)-methyltransferase